MNVYLYTLISEAFCGSRQLKVTELDQRACTEKTKKRETASKRSSKNNRDSRPLGTNVRADENHKCFPNNIHNYI